VIGPVCPRIADVCPERLYLTRVDQKTFVEVNEEGTEAAAATAVGVTSAPQVFEMKVDRPFVLAIPERLSGTVLFLGVMNAERQASLPPKRPPRMFTPPLVTSLAVAWRTTLRTTATGTAGPGHWSARCRRP
jgi:serpin (serine protease inhibitor)